MRHLEISHESQGERGRRESETSAETLAPSPMGLGQNRPHQRPQHCPQRDEAEWVRSAPELGEPLTIRQVALLIGCSVWTVRQRHLRHGLPHFRTGPSGKYVFYRDQVIHWLLKRQRKGGM